MSDSDCDFETFLAEYENTPTESISVIEPTHINVTIPDVSLINTYDTYLISGLFLKTRYNTNIGTVFNNITGRTYREAKKQLSVKKYTNSLFYDWQNLLIDHIHDNKNIILKIATSCGKTWATNAIISYYILSTSNTALFITPNFEIMRDNVDELLQNNYKIYLYPGSKIVDTQTRLYSTYSETEKSSAQILCITADNFIQFVTNDINYDFIKKLKYIVFDEVHLPEIADNVKWANYIPHEAQILLLSATINNLEALTENLKGMSDRDVAVIDYNIRPIPLQRLLYKGSFRGVTGLICPSLKSKSRLSCQISTYDPTIRDVIQLSKLAKIDIKTVLSPDTSRNDQYELGQKLLKMVDSGVIIDLIEADLCTAITDPTPENLYNLLSYLFSNDMQPVIVFNTDSNMIKTMIGSLINYIQIIEQSDPEYILALNAKARIDKEEKKMKNSENEKSILTKAFVNGKSISINHGAELKARSSEISEDDEDVSFVDLSALDKWKFPFHEMSHNKGMTSWMKEALNYGIGVYTSQMKLYTKNEMFDNFRDGKFKVLFADSSISVGINLPIRTCILTGDINSTLYKQMGGRAGRRGFDTQGYIIPMFPIDKIRSCLYADEPKIDSTLTSQIRLNDLVKLLIPKVLSSYYYDKEITDKTDYNIKLLKSMTSAGISKMRKLILDNYMSKSKNESVIKAQIDYIYTSKLHYHVFTNVINSNNFPETFIFINLLINGDLDYIKTDKDLIAFIATLLFRHAGSNIFITESLGDKMNSITILDDVIINYNETINNYLTDFYEARLNSYFINEINKIGIWIYIMLKQFKYISNNTKRMRNLFVEIDRKYMNARKITGLD